MGSAEALEVEAVALEAAAGTADRAGKDEKGKIWNRPKALSRRRDLNHQKEGWKKAEIRNRPLPLKQKPLPLYKHTKASSAFQKAGEAF